MSKGIIIGRWRVKPRFVFFVFIMSISILLLIGHYSRPPTPYIVEPGNMTLEYSSEAILVRDEEVYSAPEYGRVAYYANEEEYVEKEDIVATIFKANYQEEMVYQLYNIQEKMINYQQENILNDVTDQDIKNIQSKIDESIFEIQSHVKNGTLCKLIDTEKEFKGLLAQRQGLVEKKTVPDSYLKKLVEEENRISQQLKEWKIDIIAPKAGLISYHIDNFENVLTFNALDMIDINSYRDIIDWKISDEMKDKKDETGVDSPFFRIINPEKWYIVCEIKYPKVFFEENETISVSFLDFEDKTLNGNIRRIVDNNNSFLLAIEFEEDIEEFINTRNSSVRLNKSVEGLAIPKGAVVERESEKGVFKIKNDEMIFTGIEIIAECEQEDYVIIDANAGLIEKNDIIKLN